MHNEETQGNEEIRQEDTDTENIQPEEDRAEDTEAVETGTEEQKPEETSPSGQESEDPAVEESKAEEPKPEESKPEESKPEESKSEESKSEESKSEESEIHSVVGIRFEPCGKVYRFKANGLGLRRGERVVVESDMGVSIGRVVIEDHEHRDPEKELKPVLRRVSEEDLKKEEDNKSLKQEAFDFCNERIMARGLAMKLLGTDVTLDRKRIVFFFSAETRIDFRELVKDLAAKFRTRIELRQVGVRDAARITGGLGVCGRELCCRRFLTSFLPISIKMAKKQELALNTSKLSGICGRLMCCLGYEYEEKLKEPKRKRENKEREPEVAKPEKVEEQPAASPEPPKTVVQPSEDVTTPAEEETPSRKRRRRRRRRSGKRPGADRPESKEQKSASSEKPREGKPSDAKPSDAKPSGEKPAEGADQVKKPFRRKRRRRMKGKKKE